MSERNGSNQQEIGEPRTGPFQCSCGAEFEAESEYQEHLKNHADQKKAARAGVADPSCERDLLTGEQGQTEEERRGWKHTQKQDGKAKSHSA